MVFPTPRRTSSPLIAMLCAAAVSGQFIAGKATRDALFLSNLDVTLLPMVVIATSAFSILLVAIGSKMLVRLTPVVFVPLAFAANAAFLLAGWLLAPLAPAAAAYAVYLQISGLGPMLGSGFWLIASERFDPHTARRQFGQITGLGTLGGLAGALVAERVAALYGITAMLPLLAAVNMVCAWQVRRLAMSGHQLPMREGLDQARSSPPSRRHPGCACSRTQRTFAISPQSSCSVQRRPRSPTTHSRSRRSACSAAGTSSCGSSRSTMRRQACSRSSCNR